MAPSRPQVYEQLDEPVVRCPWHGFEFGLADGRSLAQPKDLRTKIYRAEIEAGVIALYV
jgi:nitrite reductase (NADH) small subunit